MPFPAQYVTIIESHGSTKQIAECNKCIHPMKDRFNPTYVPAQYVTIIESHGSTKQIAECNKCIHPMKDRFNPTYVPIEHQSTNHSPVSVRPCAYVTIIESHGSTKQIAECNKCIHPMKDRFNPTYVPIEHQSTNHSPVSVRPCARLQPR